MALVPPPGLTPFELPMSSPESCPERPPSSWEFPWLLPSAALVIYFFARNPFLGQWDSFDYLKEAITHTLSPLGFGRPVFVGFNIALWEASRRLLRISPLQFEPIAVLSVILFGGAGVFLFQRFSCALLRDRAAAMAALAFALSPSYAVYAGYVMTDVPMLVCVLAAAVLLWPESERGRAGRDVAAGILFGLSVGLREQAGTLGPALLWIVWQRRPDGVSRLRSAMLFGACSTVTTLAPVVVEYLHNPDNFVRRVGVWISVIPSGSRYFLKNFQASLLYTLALCPGAWIGLAAAAGYRLFHPGAGRARIRVSSVAGAGLALVLPLAALWRDADVQIHPRYVLVVLPAAAIVTASLYRRWLPSGRAAVAWAVLQVFALGGAQAVMGPFRQLQVEKREYANAVRNAVDGEALLIAGSYSPVFDYYRAIGVRPRWEILWSGWGWNPEDAETQILSAWKRGIPVYFCNGPGTWLYFEDERLDLYFILCRYRQLPVAPDLIRISPLHLRGAEAPR
jgi:hypothetical protein